MCGKPLLKECSNISGGLPLPSSTFSEEYGLDWKVVVLDYGCGFLFGACFEAMSNATAEEDDIRVDIPMSDDQLKRNMRPILHKPYGSMDLVSVKAPANHGSHSKDSNWWVVLNLAFQSIGIVYGDLGTSPLYVYPSIFSNGIKHRDDILGALSLVFYTLTFLPLVKYVFVVLRANDNGEGGTFALYSLICRYARVSLIPSQQAEDREVSNYKLELPSKRLKLASVLKSSLQKSQFAKIFLLLVTMLGTSMVIGDSIFTPSISVLSAVAGVKEVTSALTDDMIAGISVVILIFLFMIQRFGTHRVSYTFAPVLCVWFVLIGGIGFYNIIKHDKTVLKAINPMYIVEYFIRNKKDAWISLGGVVLCTTGAEALFADLGHFSVRAIQVSMCSMVYPALIFAYTGQSSYLRQYPDEVSDAFYKSVPGPLYWPMFVVSILAAAIASQAMISGTFSIVHQSLSLGCFPPVKVVYTSANHEGQVYIPAINYILMLACIGVTAGFKSTVKIGNAYGTAVVFVMTLTSSLLVLVMIMIWKTNIFLIILYILTIGFVELLYLSSVLYKFTSGGYLPLVFSAVLMIIMYVWNDVYRRKYHYELDHKISPGRLKEISANKNMSRIPGLAMFYSELVHGIPPIFEHYVSNVPALHSIIVFVSMKSLHINEVPPEERYFFRRVEPRELFAFRCVVRYGYKDVREVAFEETLVTRLKEFIQEEILLQNQMLSTIGNNAEKGTEPEGEIVERNNDVANAKQVEEEIMQQEIEQLQKEWEEAGIVHMIGESEVIAKKEANIMKRIVINHVYNLLKRNVRQREKVFDIPHKRMLKVGMTYQL
ncbi:potassium transporter 5 [Gossypium raimondii]|nr:potassium transporter 5 [Gossypium raimondii]